MGNINKLDTTPLLDLREWWQHVSKKNVEHIINNKDMGSYWWFNEDKTIITTIKQWKITNYKVCETDIIFRKKTEIKSKITQAIWPELLEDLLLDPTCEVKSALEAREKVKISDNKKFWFKSKDGKMVTTIDFSNWDKPKIRKYPLNKYDIKQKTIQI